MDSVFSSQNSINEVPLSKFSSMHDVNNTSFSTNSIGSPFNNSSTLKLKENELGYIGDELQNFKFPTLEEKRKSSKGVKSNTKKVDKRKQFKKIATFGRKTIDFKRFSVAEESDVYQVKNNQNRDKLENKNGSVSTQSTMSPGNSLNIKPLPRNRKQFMSKFTFQHK